MLTIKDWLPEGYLKWIHTWFTDAQLNACIDLVGLTVDSITKCEVFDRDPWQKPHEEVAKAVLGYRRLTLDYGGHTWERTETFTGTKYRVRDEYQHLKLPKLTEALMYMKFEWFRKFSWQIYGYPGEYNKDNYEIYCNTGKEHETLYVPVDCIMKGDVQGILDRTINYAKSYNNEITSPALIRATRSHTALILFKYIMGVKV